MHAPAGEGALPIIVERFDPIDEVAVESGDVPGGVDRLENRCERCSTEGVQFGVHGQASRLRGATVITSPPDSSRMETYCRDGSGRSTCGCDDHALSVLCSMRTCASAVRVVLGHRQIKQSSTISSTSRP